MNELVTIGVMSLRVGILEMQLRKLCNRGKVPHKRVGRTRVFDTADTEQIRKVAIDAGYLKPMSEVANDG
jgi:hypothetical protein